MIGSGVDNNGERSLAVGHLRRRFSIYVNIMRLRTFKLVNFKCHSCNSVYYKLNTAAGICVVRTIVPMMSRAKAKISNEQSTQKYASTDLIVTPQASDLRSLSLEVPTGGYTVCAYD